MPAIGSFSAWIVCDGRPLPEYSVQILDANTSKISCWIPSEVGKNFSVYWRDGGSCIHSCAFISLDGFVVPGRFLCGSGTAWRDGVRTSHNTERPFAFAQQANTSASGGQIHPDAGTIKLKIRWIVIEGSRMPNTLRQLPGPSGSQGSMLSHCVSFAEQIPTYEQYPETWNVKLDPSGNGSDITFVFHYRPREFLVSQGLMPPEHVVPIPPAVRMNCQVASSPLPGGSSLMTRTAPIPNPSPQVNNSSEQTGSTPQTAVDPATWPATNTRVVSEFHNREDRYPGEDILSLGLDPSIWQT